MDGSSKANKDESKSKQTNRTSTLTEHKTAQNSKCPKSKINSKDKGGSSHQVRETIVSENTVNPEPKSPMEYTLARPIISVDITKKESCRDKTKIVPIKIDVAKDHVVSPVSPEVVATVLTNAVVNEAAMSLSVGSDGIKPTCDSDRVQSQVEEELQRLENDPLLFSVELQKRPTSVSTKSTATEANESVEFKEIEYVNSDEPEDPCQTNGQSSFTENSTEMKTTSTKDLSEGHLIRSEGSSVSRQTRKPCRTHVLTCDVGVSVRPKSIRVAALDEEAEEVDGEEASTEIEITADDDECKAEEESEAIRPSSQMSISEGKSSPAVSRTSSASSEAKSRPSSTKVASATSRKSIPDPVVYEPPERRMSTASQKKSPPPLNDSQGNSNEDIVPLSEVNVEDEKELDKGEKSKSPTDEKESANTEAETEPASKDQSDSIATKTSSQEEEEGSNPPPSEENEGEPRSENSPKNKEEESNSSEEKEKDDKEEEEGEEEKGKEDGEKKEELKEDQEIQEIKDESQNSEVPSAEEAEKETEVRDQAPQSNEEEGEKTSEVPEKVVNSFEKIQIPSELEDDKSEKKDSEETIEETTEKNNQKPQGGAGEDVDLNGEGKKKVEEGEEPIEEESPATEKTDNLKSSEVEETPQTFSEKSDGIENERIEVKEQTQENLEKANEEETKLEVNTSDLEGEKSGGETGDTEANVEETATDTAMSETNEKEASDQKIEKEAQDQKIEKEAQDQKIEKEDNEEGKQSEADGEDAKQSDVTNLSSEKDKEEEERGEDEVKLEKIKEMKTEDVIELKKEEEKEENVTEVDEKKDDEKEVKEKDAEEEKKEEQDKVITENKEKEKYLDENSEEKKDEEKPESPPKSPVKRVTSPDKGGRRGSLPQLRVVPKPQTWTSQQNVSLNPLERTSPTSSLGSGVSPLASPPKSLRTPTSPKKPQKTSPRKKNGLLSPIKTPKTPGSETRKLPPIKAPVGLAPNPNLKNIKSKIGSFDNIKYKPGGGDKKVISIKLEWKAAPKIGSLACRIKEKCVAVDDVKDNKVSDNQEIIANKEEEKEEEGEAEMQVEQQETKTEETVPPIATEL